MQTILLKRGTTTSRMAVIPANGEPIWDTTLMQLFVGDGVTTGGKPLGIPLTKAQIEELLTGNLSSHTHNYLLLSGGVITGDVTAVSVKSGTPTEGCEMRYNSTSKTLDFIFN